MAASLLLITTLCLKTLPVPPTLKNNPTEIQRIWFVFVHPFNVNKVLLRRVHPTALIPIYPIILATTMIIFHPRHVCIWDRTQAVPPMLQHQKNETDTTWCSFCDAAGVALTLRAIRFSFPLSTASTVITNKMGPCYSTGQPDPFGACIPELL